MHREAPRIDGWLGDKVVTFAQMKDEYVARKRNTDWRQMIMHWHTLPPYVEGEGRDWNRDGCVSAEGDAAYAAHCDRSDVVPFLPSTEVEPAGVPMAASPSQGGAAGSRGCVEEQGPKGFATESPPLRPPAGPAELRRWLAP